RSSSRSRDAMDPMRFLRGGLLPRADDDEDATPRLSLGSDRRALIERWLPKNAGGFVAVAIGIPLAVWVAALLLAPDRAKFLHSRDWLAQPPHLTGPFV